jgi:hypothetical protein
VSHLRIVIGNYGTPWKPYHGASGGFSFAEKRGAEIYAQLAAEQHPPVPRGLWPGTPHRIIKVELQGDGERGFLVAECEPVEARKENQ